MAAPGPPPLEALLDVEGGRLFRAGRIFLQIRRGPLSEPTFERVVAALQRQRARTPRGQIHASIALTEPGCPIPSEAVRARQRAFMAEYLKDPMARMVAIVVGETVESSLLRAASRTVVRHPQLRVCAMVAEAAAWLGPELGMAAADVEALVAEARAGAAG